MNKVVIKKTDFPAQGRPVFVNRKMVGVLKRIEEYPTGFMKEQTGDWVLCRIVPGRREHRRFRTLSDVRNFFSNRTN